VFSGTPAPPPAALVRYYHQRPTWKACADDDQFECAAVRVPVDYGKASGKALGIALRRVPATDPERRKGTLFINPGGPGGSGTEMAAAAPEFFDPGVLEVWDVVGFDPRGTGGSGAFTCLTDAQLDAIYSADPTPDTAAEEKAQASLGDAAGRDCLRRGGELARHMSSDDVAKDLDILRAAVQDERLNYYGVSYGTLIGARYAEHFPSRVGLMVLDSAVRPDPVDDSDVTQTLVDAYARGDDASFDDAVDEFAANCRASVTCPLGPDAKAVAATIVTLLDRVASAPLETDEDSLPRVTEGWVVTAVDYALSDESTWPDLVDALDQAIHDHDGTGLAWLAMDAVGRDDDGTYPEGPVGNVFLPVMCADWPVTAWDTTRPSKDVAANHPLWGRVANQRFLPCLGWKGPVRPDQEYSVDLPAPVLVIGNEDDVTTPIEDTEALADLLGNARLVTVDAGGHGAYAAGSDCADDTVNAYLVDGLAPQLHTSCPA
jgi:pimeloyl-ACP methyl ester carboxylesterase